MKQSLACVLFSILAASSAGVEQRKLTTLFKVTDGGLFYRGKPGLLITPRDLILTSSGGKESLIVRLEDLKGKVHVSSPVEALNFARLRGSLATIGSLSKAPECEVILQNDINEALVFGFRELIPALRRAPIGFYGVASRELVKQSSSKLATVTPVGQSYEVRRTVLTLAPNKGFGSMLWLEEIIERVGKNGEYRRQVVRSWKADPNKWWIPLLH